MDPILVAIVGIGMLLILLFSGMHIALALALVGTVGYGLCVGFSPIPTVLAAAFYHTVAQFIYTCLPLFILMGLLAAETGTSKGLYDGIAYWTGRSKAGPGIATVGACTAFGTVCGSALVTAAVFAKVSAPEMRARGYPKSLAYGICASAGTIGMLIPPSILAVVYGVLTDESVGQILIAGVGPGLLLAFLFSSSLWIMSRMNPALIADRPVTKVSWRQRFGSLKLFWSVIVVGIIIFGGIFTGVFTPTEAGAVASLVMLVLTLLVLKGRSWSVISTCVRNTAEIGAMIFLLLCGAGMFARFIGVTGLGQTIFEVVLSWNISAFQLVLIMVIAYLIMGCFLDSVSMLAITVPVVYSVVKAFGIEPTWYAMVVIVAIHIGLITPPFGITVFAVKGVAEPDVTLEDCFRGVLPFFVMMLIAEAIILFVPSVSTILPKLMFK